jgi:hypothetical protein
MSEAVLIVRRAMFNFILEIFHIEKLTERMTRTALAKKKT